MTWAIFEGDCRDVLPGMPDACAQTVVTSPPYFGLRDYGTGEWEGGDADCQHIKGELRRGINLANSVHTTRGGAKKAAEVGHVHFSAVCERCGARRVDRQLGLEPTPGEYVAALVEVFREVRRVLRDDGTVWLNMGDSYAASAPGNKRGGATLMAGYATKRDTSKIGGGVKPKDLLGIPWMVAFALRADGWYLRMDIIWSKPNPMPESVRDRPTKAHEYLFLLSKSKRYFYDADAVREDAVSAKQTAHNERYAREYEAHTERVTDTGQPGNVNNVGIHSRPGPGGRNKRSVWVVATKPFPQAHFATFPPDLIEPCILAGSERDGIVLDPFAGAGTVGVVCRWLGRRFVGIELKPDYAQMARERIETATRPKPRRPRKPSAEQMELVPNG